VFFLEGRQGHFEKKKKFKKNRDILVFFVLKYFFDFLTYEICFGPKILTLVAWTLCRPCIPIQEQLKKWFV
jgi:hypothetical protein